MELPWYGFGYSIDAELRLQATSGGFTKEIMAWALRSGLVNKIIIAKMVGPTPRVVVTEDPVEVLAPSTNSIYHPISTLQGLRRLRVGETFAITSLPCHAPIAARHPGARLVVELLCDRTPFQAWTDRVLSICGVKAAEVEEFSYRRGLWPGNGYVRLFDGREMAFDFHKEWNFGRDDLQPKKCLSCTHFCTGPHITVADPWFLLERNDPCEPGKTLVRIRDREILEWVAGANVVLEPLDRRRWDQSTWWHRGRKEQRR